MHRTGIINSECLGEVLCGICPSCQCIVFPVHSFDLVFCQCEKSFIGKGTGKGIRTGGPIELVSLELSEELTIKLIEDMGKLQSGESVPHGVLIPSPYPEWVAAQLDHNLPLSSQNLLSGKQLEEVTK